MIAIHGVTKHHSRAASPMFFPDNHSNIQVDAQAKAKIRPFSRVLNLEEIKALVVCTSIKSAIIAIGNPTAIASSIGLTTNQVDHVRTDWE